MFNFLRRKPAHPPSSVAQSASLQGVQLWFTKLSLTAKSRMRIYEKLGKFVANGVPIVQALGEIHLHVSMDGKKPNAPVALALNEWRRAVLNGQSFARALDGWAPKSELSVLEAGEVSGRFDRAVEDVLFVYQSGRRIRTALGGLIYPVFLLLSTCLYLYIFGVQVIPAFSAVLPKERWVGAGQTMAQLSDFVQTGLLPLLVVMGLVLTVIVTTLGVWTGPVRKIADRFPPWGIYRLVMGSNFLISLGALLNAGVSVPESLRIMARYTSPWYRERLVATRQQMLNGARNIGDALYRTGFQFPSWDIVIDIRSYAALDGFEAMLDKLSRQWLDDSVSLINRQMDIMRNAAIVIMGLVFMWIASGMFDLQQQIQASAMAGS